MMTELTAENGACDIAIAAITITSERQDLGIPFAFPYTKGSVSIMIKTLSTTSEGWAWVQPFSTNLWIAIAVTMLIWPVAVYMLEMMAIKRRLPRHSFFQGIQESMWRSLWSLQHGDKFDVSSLAARVAVIAFAFMALILCSSYTANLAAFLTVKKLTSIDSIYDLSSQAVSSVPIYIPRLQARYGIMATDANVSTIDDVESQAGQVAAGRLAAFIYDTPMAQYVTATFAKCAVRLLPDTIEPFDYGIAFKKGTNDSLVDAFSREILLVQEAGEVQELTEEFYLESSPCLSASASGDGSTSRITFEAVYGLWIILGAGLLLGALIVGIVRFRRRGHWAASDNKKHAEANLTSAAAAPRTSNRPHTLFHENSTLDARRSAFVDHGDLSEDDAV